MQNESDKPARTQVDYRAAIAITLWCMAAAVLIGSIVVLSISNQQQPVMTAVFIVALAAVSLGYFLMLRRAEKRHAAHLVDVIRVLAPGPGQRAQVVDPAPALKRLGGGSTWGAAFGETQPIRMMATDGRVLELDRELARRFITNCYPVCNRAKLGGANADYSEATEFFSEMQGRPLLPDGNGWRWAQHVSAAALDDWYSNAIGVRHANR